MEQALPVLKNLIKDYQLRDINNMDETDIFSGLFDNLSSDKTIAQKQIQGLKKDKTRITLCLASNADGSDKLELMIIGHFKKPRCFQSKSGNQPGFYYRSNNKAWMTRDLFQEWLLKFIEKIKKEQRYFLLLLDNAPSHISNGLEITNVKIQFLPPNTTSQM
ncbi:hypothetical protein K3495_g3333 [Podosphaera aphanis]|nr:hypothetical protein K3495_g3333 [Podosphaera aphanis]